jgi:hypothetical protein
MGEVRDEKEKRMRERNLLWQSWLKSKKFAVKTEKLALVSKVHQCK